MPRALVRLAVLVLLLPAFLAPSGAVWAWCVCPGGPAEAAATVDACCEHDAAPRVPEAGCCDADCDDCGVFELDTPGPLHGPDHVAPLDDAADRSAGIEAVLPPSVVLVDATAHAPPIERATRHRSGVLTLRN
jgi:hypothetical protein